jgi:hypothetical protein
MGNKTRSTNPTRWRSAGVGLLALVAAVASDLAISQIATPKTTWRIVAAVAVAGAALLLAAVLVPRRNAPVREHRSPTPSWVLDWMERRGYTLLAATADEAGLLLPRRGRFLARPVSYSHRGAGRTGLVAHAATLTDEDTGAYIYCDAYGNLHLLVDVGRLTEIPPLDPGVTGTVVVYHEWPTPAAA